MLGLKFTRVVSVLSKRGEKEWSVMFIYACKGSISQLKVTILPDFISSKSKRVMEQLEIE